jgi:hypothetical protein
MTRLTQPLSIVDCAPGKADVGSVKNAKSVAEPKTRGTVTVERHRPLLNKLSQAQRRRLRQRAAGLLYGHEAPAPGR